MNKKQIITSVGVALLAIGVVGGIWSGIEAMPKVINNVQIAQNKQNEKEVIYNSEEKIVKLNIDSSVSHIFIKKHNKPNVIVERSGNKEISTITAENKNNELTIKEENRNITKETKNVDDIVRYVIDEMYSSYSSEITVYLPEEVNVDIKTNDNGLIVEDDVLLDTLDYETSSGNISLRAGLNLKNLNIKSLSHVSLSTEEISGIKNIKVIANSVDIQGNNYIGNETDIPENIEIKTTAKDYEVYDVNINAEVPVAKNLIIDSASTVEIELPLVDYKFNFDVKASRGIKFEASDDEKYKNTPVEKYFENTNYEEETNLTKELKGFMNEEVNNNENEYIVKVKSGYTIFN
ncbi:hypothetical protein [Romboutsia sp.]|uniref:hypothetical protein n=1 Tax=Romboutsia sp. TaxID=1965302 RepID=UPI003F36F8F1